MEYITWNQLLMIVAIAAILAACTYLVILIRRLNESVKTFNGILKKNVDNINQTLKNMPQISENMVQISETAKNELKVLESAIDNINETAEITAATVETLKTDVVGKIKSVVELVELIKRMFAKEKNPL